MLISTKVNEILEALVNLGVTDIEKVAGFFIEAGFNLNEVIRALKIGTGGPWELALTYRLEEILKELN